MKSGFLLSLARRTVSPAVNFISHLKEAERVMIVHDDDPDGICSAVLLSKGCEKITLSHPRIHSTGWGESLTPKIVQLLKGESPRAIIFTDVPAIPKNLLAQAAQIAPILILDHHFPEIYEDVTYVNPRLIEPEAYLPSSCLAFYILRGLGLSEDHAWIAGIGILADHGVENCRPLFRQIKKRFPGLIGGARLADIPLLDTSPLGELTRIITAATIVEPKRGMVIAFEALSKSTSYSDILRGDSPEARRLLGWHHIVEVEFRRILAEARKNVESAGPNLVLYRFSSKLRIKSLVANYLPRLYASKIVLVIQRDGAYTHVSLRRGARNHTDLRFLVQSAVEAIPNASGGGHPEASAARLPTEHVEEFLKRLKETSGNSMAN